MNVIVLFYVNFIIQAKLNLPELSCV